MPETPATPPPSHRIDPMAAEDHRHSTPPPVDIVLNPKYSAPEYERVPRFHLPQSELQAGNAPQLVLDDAMLDGNARLNLATFVGTWMEPEADQLYAATFDKNIIDKDEYPQTAAIEERCVRILANLWNSPEADTTLGTSCVGSSEACMLGGLAMKRRWQERRRAEGKSTDRPNLVMSAAVQVVWEKFANYWDVEMRLVPVSGDAIHRTPEGMLGVVDENTIGVVVIMGQTYTGIYEPVKELAAALDDLQHRTGLDIPIHVDGASGAMVAPFLQPDLEWDFRLPRVHSINTSGHKYGLVYPGVGWVVWRTKDLRPEDLIFHVSYLGGDMPTFGLNFSRPGAQILLQYYTFVRYGREGFTRIHGASQTIAKALSDRIGAMEQFTMLSDGSDIPVFAWSLDASVKNWDLHDLARSLRERGWLVPAYPMPKDREDLTVMRVVVRAGFTPDMAWLFLDTLQAAVDSLDSLSGPIPKTRDDQPGFHH
ncbi:glutamate decarboxylase [soil metagenome]